MFIQAPLWYTSAIVFKSVSSHESFSHMKEIHRADTMGGILMIKIILGICLYLVLDMTLKVVQMNPLILILSVWHVVYQHDVPSINAGTACEIKTIQRNV